MFSLSGKSENQIPCFPRVAATLIILRRLYLLTVKWKQKTDELTNRIILTVRWNIMSLRVLLGLSKQQLPPANVVCEGYVFTGVCLSTGGGGLQAHTQGESWGGSGRGRGLQAPTPWGGVCSRGCMEAPPVTATAVGYKHPTGMHSWFDYLLMQIKFFQTDWTMTIYRDVLHWVTPPLVHPAFLHYFSSNEVNESALTRVRRII